MNKANGPVNRIKIAFGIALVAALTTSLTACGGYVEGGGYGGYVDNGGYDGGYYGGYPGPDIYLFGGNYDRGRDVQNYSHRGSVSRAAAHSGGGGHSGGHRR